jgi:hypothetical protein
MTSIFQKFTGGGNSSNTSAKKETNSISNTDLNPSRKNSSGSTGNGIDLYNSLSNNSEFASKEAAASAELSAIFSDEKTDEDLAEIYQHTTHANSNIDNSSSTLISNSSTSGYATNNSANHNPTANCNGSNKKSANNKLEAMNNLIDDLMILNNDSASINTQYESINYDTASNNRNSINSSQPGSLTTPLTASNTYNQQQQAGTHLGDALATTNTLIGNSSTSSTSTTNTIIDLNKQQQQQQQSVAEQNGQNANDFGNPNANYSNVNYLMRRERSLDRSAATENFLENLAFVSANHHHNPNAITTTPSTQRKANASTALNSLNNQANMYANNSTLYANSNPQNNTISSSRPHRQHQRSNSILNASSISSQNPLTMLNTLSFNRDYGNTVVVGPGLRSSARALSSSSFSGANMQRDPSANSIKSYNLNPTSSGQSQNQAELLVNGSAQSVSNTNLSMSANQASSSKLNFIKDLQIRLMDLQKECYYLRCELDTTQQKLSSSMQSIKQFWSPELKRERQQRKEETAKYALLIEQYKLLQSQYQNLLDTYEQQSQQMQQMQMQMQQVQQQQAHEDLITSTTSTKHLLREKNLLKKTIGEIEMRINVQKQIITTKDETIKKLFQLVKSMSNKNSQSANNSNDLGLIGMALANQTDAVC